MSFQDVEDHIRFSSKFSGSEQTTMLKAMERGYDHSATAHEMLDRMVSENITITVKKRFDFAANRESDTLFVDPDWLETRTFIDAFGKKVHSPLPISLLHEMSHVINDITDPTPAQIANHDYIGDNVRVENHIRSELGMDLRPSYFNGLKNEYMDLMPMEFKNSYTNGAQIDLALIAAPSPGFDFDTTGLGPTRDLMLGFGPANNMFKSGDGADFLYGYFGADTLDGGGSEDFIFGGAGRDTLIAGGGDNTMDGGSGKDIAELVGFKFLTTLSVSGDTKSFTNQATSEINILKNIETIRFTATTNNLPAEINSTFVAADAPTVLAQNDDGYQAASLSQAFERGLNFFGAKYTEVYVNNNGNLTFGNGLSSFTPGAIGGTSGLPIIAAYWADVDTRGSGGGTVSFGYNAAHDSFVATWSNVDYYNATSSGHVTKTNSYQIEIFDQGAGDAEIIIRYGNLNWTTGDASGGSGGLGGTTARAGLNSGNSTFQYEMTENGVNPLSLDTLSNCGRAGVFRFSVHNGTIIEDSLGADGFQASDLDWTY